LTYTTTVEYDEATGEHFITLPPELLCALGWQGDDELLWRIEDDCVILTKA